MEPTINPYASPLSDAPPPLPQAAEVNWLALARVATGLRLIFLGIGICLVPPVISALLQLADVGFQIYIIVGMGCFAMLFAGALLNFIGSTVCRAVPAETGARGLMTASVVAMLPTIGVLSLGALDMAGIHTNPPELMLPLWLLSQAVSTICFLLFMRRLNRLTGREDLIRWTEGILVLLICMAFFFFVIYAVLAGSSRPVSGGAIVGMLWLSGIGGWLAFAAKAILIRATRRAILSRDPTGVGAQP